MKANRRRIESIDAVRLVASFGGAQLLRHTNGRYEIRGGSATDHTEVKQWISLFRHEAAVSFPPPVGPAPAFIRNRST